MYYNAEIHSSTECEHFAAEKCIFNKFNDIIDVIMAQRVITITNSFTSRTGT